MAASVIGRIDDLFCQNSSLSASPDAQQQQQPDVLADEDVRAPSNLHAQELIDLDRFIDGDIAQRLDAPNMTWRRLDACVKWRLLKDYLTRLGISEEGEQFLKVRMLLRDRKLTSVEYDTGCREVMKINHEDCMSIDEMFPQAEEIA